MTNTGEESLQAETHRAEAELTRLKSQHKS
jgi:hypothetical protein